MLRKNVIALTVLLMFGTLFYTSAHAQTETSCPDRGLSTPPKNLAANLHENKWLIAWAYGGIKYETFIIFSEPGDGQVGMAITKFYLAASRQTRYIAQAYEICYKKEGQTQTVAMINIGIMDVDTGETGDMAGYSPDNFYLVFRKGKTSAEIVDNAGRTSPVDTELLDRFPADVINAFDKIE